MCEIGKSAYRGHEVIYPQPFGVITTAAEKQYPVDYSHFNIMGTAVGACGIEADSDKAIFPAVDLEVAIGSDNGIKFRLPWLISGIGSTNIAKNNWEGLAIGSALAGTGLTIGENVVGMDPEAVFKNGKIVDTVDLKRRVKLYKDHQRDGYGAIIVQANLEDSRLKVQEYAIENLGVECVELKWGQGAKDIGGEVKINRHEALREHGRRPRPVGHVQPRLHDLPVLLPLRRALHHSRRHDCPGGQLLLRQGTSPTEDWAPRQSPRRPGLDDGPRDWGHPPQQPLLRGACPDGRLVLDLHRQRFLKHLHGPLHAPPPHSLWRLHHGTTGRLPVLPAPPRPRGHLVGYQHRPPLPPNVE